MTHKSHIQPHIKEAPYHHTISKQTNNGKSECAANWSINNHHKQSLIHIQISTTTI